MSNASSPVSGDAKAARLKRLRSLIFLLDNAIPIPGTSYRFGLDPIIGLVPGAGDLVGAVFSAYIVLEAALMGFPRETLMRMVFNVIIDTVVGLVPILGDWFDFVWKANVKNLALMEAHIGSPQPSRKADKRFIKWFTILLLGGVILLIFGIIAILGIMMILVLKLIKG